MLLYKLGHGASMLFSPILHFCRICIVIYFDLTFESDHKLQAVHSKLLAQSSLGNPRITLRSVASAFVSSLYSCRQTASGRRAVVGA